MRALLYMQHTNDIRTIFELVQLTDKSIGDVIADLEALISAGMTSEEAYDSLKEYYKNNE